MAEINTAHIQIVLVEPHNAGNIGAAARALYNMGLEHLALVGWHETVEARRIAFEWATDGEPVLKRARRCATLEEALAGCGLAIATSARRGEDRPPAISRTDLIALLNHWTPSNQVAIVFGPERTGLRTEHLALCTHTMTIPTAPGKASLNLAQAVLLVGYEILIASGLAAAAAQPADIRALDRVATRAERRRLYEHASEALRAVNFLRPGRPDRPLDEICWMLDRAAATSHEVRILHGMCRKILRAVRKNRNGEQ
ncbi:MAG: hypothetical protein N3D11_17740 [Candidatus Sumerlaeia bacterium]|nr:hypothetical protein [Candidatus Sumerlaeia bacterium]